MSLRQQAKILGVSHPYLSQMINGRRAWNAKVKARYDELVATTFATTSSNTKVKSDGKTPYMVTAHSSSGLGHRPLKAEITGSNPVCATIHYCFGLSSIGSWITHGTTLLARGNAQ